MTFIDGETDNRLAGAVRGQGVELTRAAEVAVAVVELASLHLPVYVRQGQSSRAGWWRAVGLHRIGHPGSGPKLLAGQGVEQP